MIFKSISCNVIRRQNLKSLWLNNSLAPFVMNNSSNMFSSLPSGEENVVISEVIKNKGVLTINRPKKLNSANLEVCQKILLKLLEWENKVEMVIIKGEGRAFCAGGDVASVTLPGPKNNQAAKEFFRTEYSMNCLIGHYNVPYVALIHGITMGGGVGLSVHGPVRIATEKTLFAMPETIIGLFPDVGSSYVLSRMPNHLGHYLALTGHRLQGTDVVKAGIATHYTNSENIPTIYQNLINLENPQKNLKDFLVKNTDDVSSTKFSLEPQLQLIDNCFSAPTVEEVFVRLQKDGSEFSIKTLNLLKKMSPISLKISKKLLEIAKDKNLEECLTIDNRLSVAAVEARVSPDFFEGVRALLIDKDQNPKWKPPTLEEVTDKMVKAVFDRLSPEEELNYKERTQQWRTKVKANL